MTEPTKWEHPKDCGCGKCDSDKVLTRMYEAEYQVHGLERALAAYKEALDEALRYVKGPHGSTTVDRIRAMVEGKW